MARPMPDLRSGRKVQPEDLLRSSGGMPPPCRDAQLSGVLAGQASRSRRRLRHGLDGVHHYVEQGLLEQVAVGAHLHAFLFHLHVDVDVRGCRWGRASCAISSSISRKGTLVNRRSTGLAKSRKVLTTRSRRTISREMISICGRCRHRRGTFWRGPLPREAGWR